MANRRVLSGRSLFRGRRSFCVVFAISAFFVLAFSLFVAPLYDRSGKLSNRILRARGVKPPDRLKPFPFCDASLAFFIPCFDPKIAVNFPKLHDEFREKHCPDQKNRVRCITRAPQGYRSPIQWPFSRDTIWRDNVPLFKILSNPGSQGWVREEWGKWVFPLKVEKYIRRLQAFIPLQNGAQIRTALDIGCGVGSLGAHLLDYDVLTLSLAPKDQNQGQVAFALERGTPAMLGLLATRRLPLPPSAFDLVHCGRCSVDFLSLGGAYLMEVDRLLRTGGYFVLAGPPVFWQGLEADWQALQSLASSLCWRLSAGGGKQEHLAVWQKGPKKACHPQTGAGKGKDSEWEDNEVDSKEDAHPPLTACGQAGSADAYDVWDTALEPGCEAPEVNLTGLRDWPVRLSAPPLRFPALLLSARADAAAGKTALSLPLAVPGNSTGSSKAAAGGAVQQQQQGGVHKEAQEEEWEEGGANRQAGAADREEKRGGAAGRENEEGGVDEDEAKAEASQNSNEGTATQETQQTKTGSLAQAKGKKEHKEEDEEDFARRRRRLLDATTQAGEPRRQAAGSKGAMDFSVASAESLPPGQATGQFNKDTRRWQRRMQHLKQFVHSKLAYGARNVLDVNAELGGFAASLLEYPVWVMNVVPVNRKNTLPVIYDRGLIGVSHDWCEAFSTYPRTYDFIHACAIRFVLTLDGCNLIDVMVEWDRILRPGGMVVVRDSARVLTKVLRVARALRWTARIVETEEGRQGKDVLLIASKPTKQPAH